MSLFLLLIGLALLAGGTLLGFRIRRVVTWPTARAKIVERSVNTATRPTGGARNARYVPRVRYVFELDGRTYEGSDISPVQETMTSQKAQRVIDAIPDEVEIHYDPETPSRAYMTAGPYWLAVALVVLGGLSVLAGLVAFLPS